jgi:nifR3 family TIM-barrel protein
MLKNVERKESRKIPGRTSFRLRGLEVFPNTILSPMDGVTDAPFRRLCRVLSGNRMGLLVSEFVPTDGDAVFRLDGHKQLKFFPEERPFGVQIFGRFPDKMADAAKKIAVALRPDFIEVNAGCPAPKVAGKGSGSGLLRDLPRLQEILHDVRVALDGCGVEMPLTLKCRIGWDSDSINVMETLAIAEGEGVEMLTVHGRTRLQGYNGLADWDWIGKVATAARIPVIGNGDVNSVEVARERIDNYGVSGVSIGRGAMHNPWIFGAIADAWEGKSEHVISAAEALDVFKLYYGFKIEDGSTEMGALGRLKQLAARLCKGFCRDDAADGDDAAMQVRQTLLTAQTPDEFFDRLHEMHGGLLKDLVFDPGRLVNLNGAKETELKFGDQFAGR